MTTRTLESLPPSALEGQRALVRVDFNVPLKNAVVTDDGRIRAALPTITYLRDHGARVVLLSHLGRPKNGPDPHFSLRQIVRDVERILGVPVEFIEDLAVGVAATRRLPRGGVALVENTRFWPGEEQNDAELARQLAALGDFYVNDAFGSAHRAHASTEAVAHLLKPAVAGYLMERELRYLGAALDQPRRPFVAVLGGAKISGKIDVIAALLPKCDAILIGGAMAFTFLAAEGGEVGDSLVEPDRFDDVRVARQKAADRGVRIELPQDVVIAAEMGFHAPRQTVSAAEIPRGTMGFDIGPRTVEEFARLVTGAGTILWNGPMGVFELEPFSAGTRGIALAVAGSDAFTLVGGGDSLLAVKRAGLEDRFDHLSTGGGASLEFLEGAEMPGITVLEDR